MNVTTKWFDDFKKKDLPESVEGKVFCITGTTSGTGFVAARTVAEKGGTAVLLNRKSSRVDTMLSKLKEAVPDGKFELIECDLQSFDSVRKAATDIKAKYKSLYCLCNNAGIMATPDKATVDGYDTQMQTNHLSHFLLTQQLLPLLEACAETDGDARIVNHSSEARHQFPPLQRKYLEKNGGNLGGDQHKFMSGGEFHRYFQSKLANSVFSYGLHEKLQAKGSKVKAIDAHPGGSDTNLGDHLQDMAAVKFVFTNLSSFLFQTAEDGSMGILKGMMSAEAESGVLYGPYSRFMPMATRGPAVPNPPKKYETDPDAIKMLWETSEEATGVKFDI